MQATIKGLDMAWLYLEALAFLPQGNMGDEIALYAHYVACGWHKDEVQTLNTLTLLLWNISLRTFNFNCWLVSNENWQNSLIIFALHM